jgi:hypothetical protein
MWLTRFWMEPFTHNFSTLNDHTPDQRIWSSASQGMASKFQTPLHHRSLKGSTHSFR